MLKTCKIYACTNGMLGLHLSRAPWDPYPWISGVQKESNAYRGGLLVGDTVLELNGNDVLGQKISQIAEQIHEHWRTGASYLTLTIWRSHNEMKEEDGNQNVINQQSLQKFATCLQHIAQLLECPVCLEVIKPPGWQCCNGHVLCTNCRSRSEKCPVCRVPLGPRGRCLLSDKLFILLAENFPCDGVQPNETEVDNEVSVGVKMTQCKSNMATIVEGSNGDTDLQLDSQKFPDDNNKNTKQNMNAGGVLLSPNALNTATGSKNTGIEYEAPNFNKDTEVCGGNPDDDPQNSLTEEYAPKVWHKLVQKWPIISEQLALLVICALLWTIGSILLPEYAQPHTAIMRISLLIVGAQIAGVLVTFVHLPDMLGMLFFGVLYTNVGLADFTSIQPFEAFLREIALINIMLLVGIGLDADAFAKLWLMIMRLTLLPTVVEVLVITVIAHYTLSMPWIWGVLLGLVITAVSPNVIVSVLLELKKQRLGLNKGIHTLIYALTACNDVLSIFCFGVVLQLIFTTSDLKEKIIKGPVGIGIGLVYGYLYGLSLQFMPSQHSYYVNGLRFVLTVLGGMIAVMGSRAIGYTSAGALGCVEVAFFAKMGWKRDYEKKKQLEQLRKERQQWTTMGDQQQPQQQQQEQHVNSTNIPNEDANEIEDTVAKRLDLLWKFLKPVSFALIGKEINFAILDGKVVGYGVLLVCMGCLFRLVFTYISTFGGNLSRKERAYITISCFPKATVQAALGPLALDLARSLAADSQQLTLAGNVLIISVLAILLTAPLGAILMTRLAPHWLEYGSGRVGRGSRNDSHSVEMMNDIALNV